jgi:cation transport ATPase
MPSPSIHLFVTRFSNRINIVLFMETHSQELSNQFGKGVAGLRQITSGLLASGKALFTEAQRSGSKERIEFARLGFVALASLACWLKLWQPYSQFDLVGLLCAFVGGYPIFSETLEDLWSRRMTMEFSMTIALTAALIVGEVFTALIILLFVLVADLRWTRWCRDRHRAR